MGESVQLEIATKTTADICDRNIVFLKKKKNDDDMNLKGFF